MLLKLTQIYRRETHHVYCRHDRFTRRTRRVQAGVTPLPSYFPQHQPPANGGSTSIVAPSSSIIDSLAACPTGLASTRRDDLFSTVANRPSCFRLATAALSASLSVTASTVSSGTPAASFAAAQYLIVTLA